LSRFSPGPWRALNAAWQVVSNLSFTGWHSQVLVAGLDLT
jgi:hypothetical protein